MGWKRIILVIVCAALSFGGSFTCKAESNSSEFTAYPSTGAK